MKSSVDPSPESDSVPTPRALRAEDERALAVAARAAWARDPASSALAAPDDALRAWLVSGLRRVGTVDRAGDGLVAAYEVAPRPVRVHDETQAWGFTTVGFGGPGARGALGLEACLRTFTEAHAGAEADALAVLLAVVERPALHHALRDAAGFEVVRDLLALVADVDAVLSQPDPGVEAGPRDGASGPSGPEPGAAAQAAGVAAEWAATAARDDARPPVACVRDQETMTWRFRRPREGDAALVHLVASRDGAPVGFATARPGGGRLVLDDWVTGLDDHLALRALVRAAAQAARDAGLSELATTCADTQPEWPLFQAFGFRVRPLRAFLLARTRRRPVDPTWLYEHWAYTPADLLLAGSLSGLDS